MAKTKKEPTCWECGKPADTKLGPLVPCQFDPTHIFHESERKVHEDDCKNEPIKPKSKNGGGTGFNAPYTPSKELAAVIGPAPIPKSKMTSLIWVYFKENNLQDPKDKRKINADKKLQPVFDKLEKGRKQIGMLEVAKLLGANSTKA